MYLTNAGMPQYLTLKKCKQLSENRRICQVNSLRICIFEGFTVLHISENWTEWFFVLKKNKKEGRRKEGRERNLIMSHHCLKNFLGSPALRTESSMLPTWPKESGSYLPFQPQSTPYFWFSVLQPQKHFMVLAFAWGPPVGFSLFPLSPQSQPQASNSLTCAHPSTFNQGATFTCRTDLTELQR